MSYLVFLDSIMAASEGMSLDSSMSTIICGFPFSFLVIFSKNHENE